MKFMKVVALIFSLVFLFQTVSPCTIAIWSIKTDLLAGKVVDEYGREIPNAAIQIYRVKNDKTEIIAELAGDEFGRFEIKGIAPG